MSYSCNNNQNHLVKDGRLTSRVLQPPGGASSLCLGGYGGGSTTTFSSSGKGSVRRQMEEPSDSRGGHDSFARPPIPSRYERKDSLDRFMEDGPCTIPGLQEHYQGLKQSSYRVSRQDSGSSILPGPQAPVSRGPAGKNEYAAQLQAQIDQKATLTKDGFDQGNLSRRHSFERNSSGRTENDENTPYRRSPSLSSSGTDAVSGKLRLPPGGKSSFSIGWN